jgi:Fusaric acid resistance protein-like
MGQPYGKTGLPSDWQRNFLRSITSFNLGNLKISAGIRTGVLIIVLLAIGLVSDHIRESVLAVLGTINVSLLEIQQPKWTKMTPTLILVSIINAFLFTIGSLIGTTGSYLGASFFAFGLFIISYMGVYPNATSIVIISSVIFSVGVSMPGINIIPSGERFLLLFLGGLWGTLGTAIIPIIILTKKKSRSAREAIPATATAKPSSVHNFSLPHPIIQVFNPLTSNISLRSGHFQFAIAFAITGAIGLLIAQGLGLLRGYWVLITICVLLLRSDISVTFSFTSMRIIGTIVGAVIGIIIIANVVHNIWLLTFILFVLASSFFAVRNVNYALATFFLTPFVLVLLDILIPGQTLLAQTRILDTLIGAGLTLIGVSIVWMFSTTIQR